MQEMSTTSNEYESGERTHLPLHLENDTERQTRCPIGLVLMNADLVSHIMEHMAWDEILVSQRVSKTFKAAANFTKIRKITYMSPSSRESNVDLPHNDLSASPCPLLGEYPGPKRHYLFRKPEQLKKPGSWQQMFLTWPPVTICTACLTYQSDQRSEVTITIKRAEVRDPEGLTIGSILSRARHVHGEVKLMRHYSVEEVTTTVDRLEEELAKERQGEPVETSRLVDSAGFCPSVCWLPSTA